MTAFAALTFRRQGAFHRYMAAGMAPNSDGDKRHWFAIYRFHKGGWWLRTGHGVDQFHFPVKSVAAGITAASLYLNDPNLSINRLAEIIDQNGLGRIDKRTRYK